MTGVIDVLTQMVWLAVAGADDRDNEASGLTVMVPSAVVCEHVPVVVTV